MKDVLRKLTDAYWFVMEYAMDVPPMSKKGQELAFALERLQVVIESLGGEV